MVTDSTSAYGIVQGAIVLDGYWRRVRVQGGQLRLDARAWFGAQARGHCAVAKWMAERGDAEAASAMGEVADELGALLERGWLVPEDEIWPPLAYRAALPLWSVDSAETAAAYARLLLEHSAPADEDTAPEFVFQVEDAATTLLVAPHLAEAAAHVGPYVRARVVDTGLLGGCRLDGDAAGHGVTDAPPPFVLDHDREGS